MHEYAVHFNRCMWCDEPVSSQLNEFLSNHPNYSVKCVSFDNPKGTCVENLFVVFNVKDTEDEPED